MLQERQNRQLKKENNSKNRNNKELSIVAYIFVGLFVLLMGYFVYFNIVKSPSIINSSYNTRQDLFAKKVIRGKIVSSDGKILAQTVVSEDGTESREYPYDNMYAHVVGYASKGKAGLESLMNFNLLTSNAPLMERIIKEFKGVKNTGDNVVTTLDSKLQETAYKALGSNNGAVVVMEADTGRILAMVSKPDYNPNDIDTIWDSLVATDNTEDSSLLNRATQGKYPPGSTFKILTLMEYIRENPDYENYTYECSGKIVIDDSTINCYHNTVHGTEDLYQSFAKSCNSSFANIGLQLNINSLSKLCNEFLFNSALPYSMVYNKSSFTLTNKAETYDIMQTMIGQGETLVSPLHMALITQTIANNGVMMKPYLVDHTENYDGKVVKKYKDSAYDTIISEKEAAILKDFMQNVVENGTATKLSGQSYTVAGKTGSAEYGNVKGQSHAWFVGFSPVEDSKIVVSIVVEEAGAGSEYAVPIAKKIFDAYYN
ncbi:peptidoglycan glycosyltransferase [Lachnotalea glycerini]|uniref:Peptidoglycan glycosyltransferase n=1 Tax=Lachnotalea glycerini TaxID=1763509 RepID=A0A318EWW7_9FIRM|nr:peptidoglycan glycosyltransferase [Lachnotalea glycerini]